MVSNYNYSYVSNYSYADTVPFECRSLINQPGTPPFDLSCSASLYSPRQNHNATFQECCEGIGSKVSTFAVPDRDGVRPCYQYCQASDIDAQIALFRCLKLGFITRTCPGKYDRFGLLIAAAPAKSLSTGGLLVAGLALVGMLHVWV
ncbi:hypothetical protein VE01_09891 [Pseudogymnoascus verrucosus]|uniref:Uncharacterized protein n=1 Tax=Pseudogymnoascus verrucosus TaxID=342668 RepID=A0A1B8G7X4_9PEZI|nr:uncharacterized protein VE01_09891 [Pseudogymnoascus verrucosus]OBT91938.1 hypothetical protein VE01_09891 [Pseudogymnoascus verrucosus]